jgi:hypothetical protein
LSIQRGLETQKPEGTDFTFQKMNTKFALVPVPSGWNHYLYDITLLVQCASKIEKKILTKFRTSIISHFIVVSRIVCFISKIQSPFLSPFFPSSPLRYHKCDRINTAI